MKKTENGALHAINTLRLANQLSESCSELKDNELQIKGQKKKRNQTRGKIAPHQALSKRKS